MQNIAFSSGIFLNFDFMESHYQLSIGKIEKVLISSCICRHTHTHHILSGFYLRNAINIKKGGENREVSDFIIYFPPPNPY